jgi:hypothetical protein
MFGSPVVTAWNQIQRRHDPALERDVPGLAEARQLPDARRLASLAVLHDVDHRGADLDLAEGGVGDAVDLDTEAEVAVRVHARHLISRGETSGAGEIPGGAPQ